MPKELHHSRATIAACRGRVLCSKGVDLSAFKSLKEFEIAHFAISQKSEKRV
jgi:hypothetical protein